jgi:hypothetical protein
MTDPTYRKSEIEANLEWHVAWVLSEIENDNAPIGWSRHINTARCLLAAFDIKPNQMADHERDPETPEEWQEAADAASFMLKVDSCYQYGLLTGPPVRVGRCEWILAEARKRGIVPKEITG